MESRRTFWEQINIQIACGKTILLTTHNLEEADALAKRIIVINRGEIIIDGTPDEVKGHVGGKHVRFHASHLSMEDLQAIAGVQSVRLSNKKFEIYTKQPESPLAALFKDGVELSDLEVEGARLEEAFLALRQAQDCVRLIFFVNEAMLRTRGDHSDVPSFFTKNRRKNNTVQERFSVFNTR